MTSFAEWASAVRRLEAEVQRVLSTSLPAAERERVRALAAAIPGLGGHPESAQIAVSMTQRYLAPALNRALADVVSQIMYEGIAARASGQSIIDTAAQSSALSEVRAKAKAERTARRRRLKNETAAAGALGQMLKESAAAFGVDLEYSQAVQQAQDLIGLGVDLTVTDPDELARLVQESGQRIAEGKALIGGSFHIENEGALRSLTERIGRNAVYDFHRLAARTQRRIGEALVEGLTKGLGPRETAALVAKRAGVAYAQALTIARTEQADSFKANRMDFMASNPYVHRWQWVARTDCCPICSILHGQTFTLDTQPDGHPNCRCVVLPVVDGSDPLLPGSDEAVELGARSDPAAKLARTNQPRSADAIRASMPKSWAAATAGWSRADFDALVYKQANDGWRDSWAIRDPTAAAAAA